MIEHKPLYQAMINAASQTMENMLFMEVLEHFDRGYEIPADDLAWTSMLIHDPVQGEVRLAMPRSLLKMARIWCWRSIPRCPSMPVLRCARGP